MPSMKAIQVSAPGAPFELVNKEIPEPKENQARIKVQACGVCHGEALVKDGHYHGLQYPRVPGHEVVGTIERLGSKTTPWVIGQRVGVGWYGGPCGKCDACRRGEWRSCQNPLTIGISFDGGYAEYMAAPIQLARGRRTIRGWVGRAASSPSEDALHFSVLCGVRPRIEVLPLEQAARAYEKMMAAQVHFRSMLHIGDR